MSRPRLPALHLHLAAPLGLLLASVLAVTSTRTAHAQSEDGACLPADVAQDPVDPPGAATYDLSPLADSDPDVRALQKARSAAQLRLAERVVARPGASVAARTFSRYLLVQRAIDDKDLAAQQRWWRALASEGPLVDRARLALGELAAARHDLKAALRWLAQVRPTHPQHPRTTVWRLSLALDAGDLAAADEAVAAVPSSQLTRRERAWYRLRRGDLRRRRQDTAGAIEDYLAAWRAKQAPWADEALERLFAVGRPPGRLDQVHARLDQRLLRTSRPPTRGPRARKRKRLIVALETLAAQEPGLLAYARGRLESRVRATREEAIKSLQAAVAEAKDPITEAYARYHLGDLLGRLNRDKEAIAVLEPLAARTTGHAIEPRTRYRLHRLYKAQGRMLDAERMLASLTGPGIDGSLRRTALWALAWRRYRVGDLHESLRLLDLLAADVGTSCTTGRQPWRARIRYWQARAQARLGDRDTALAGLREVATRWPMTWYGLLALDRLRQSAPALAAEVAGTAPPAGPTPTLSVRDVSVAQVPALDEAVFLLRVGESRAAIKRLRALLGKGLSRGGVQLLAALYHKAGRQRSALYVLRRFTRSAVRPEGGAVSLWRQAFPTPWKTLFTKAADSAGIPRALLYAVARHESSFVPTAQSGAGAIGLVQLLPSVARRIAGLYGRRKPRPRALRRPKVNLPLGAWYLSELSRFLRDNHALVTAGYNAGPYAVRRWLRKIGVVPTDVFVESIPYRGAAAYAMRVCTTAATYAWLYPQWQERDAIALGRAAIVPPATRLGPFMTGRKATASLAPSVGAKPAVRVAASEARR